MSEVRINDYGEEAEDGLTQAEWDEIDQDIIDDEFRAELVAKLKATEATPEQVSAEVEALNKKLRSYRDGSWILAIAPALEKALEGGKTFGEAMDGFKRKEEGCSQDWKSLSESELAAIVAEINELLPKTEEYRSEYVETWELKRYGEGWRIAPNIWASDEESDFWLHDVDPIECLRALRAGELPSGKRPASLCQQS